MQIGDNRRSRLAAHSNGVNVMRERVRALGGSLSNGSLPQRRVVPGIHLALAVQAPALTHAVDAASSALPAAGRPA